MNMILSVYLRRSLSLQSKKGTKTFSRMALIGYNLVRVDHSINSKQDGVCIFYKEVLDVCIFKSLSFTEGIICEISIQNSNSYVGVVYTSQRQDSFESGNFLSNYEKRLSDLLLAILYLP